MSDRDAPGWWHVLALWGAVLGLLFSMHVRRYEIRHHHHVGDSVVVEVEP